MNSMVYILYHIRFVIQFYIQCYGLGTICDQGTIKNHDRQVQPEPMNLSINLQTDYGSTFFQNFA